MSRTKAKTEVAENQAPLIIRAQYTRDLSFENPNPLAAFDNENTEAPSIPVEIEVRAHDLGSRTYEVILDSRINATRGETTLFVIELSYAGIVTVHDCSEDQTQKLVMIDTPHLLFPFVRNIIGDMTRDSGFPPLLLSPIDFEALYHQRKNEVKN